MHVSSQFCYMIVKPGRPHHYKCHQETPDLSKSVPQNNPWCEMDGQGEKCRAMGKGKPSPHGGRDQEKVAMNRPYS